MLYHLRWSHKGRTSSALWWFYMDEEGVLGYDTCDGGVVGPHTDRLYDPVPNVWNLFEILAYDMEEGVPSDWFAAVPAPEHMAEFLSA